MNDATADLDQAEAEILAATISDDVLEAAAERTAALDTLFTMSWFHCSVSRPA